jgi:hypothetical protein
VALAAATQVESARVELSNRLAAERQQFELLRAELGGLARQWIANSLDGYLVALGFVNDRCFPAVTTIRNRHWRLGQETNTEVAPWPAPRTGAIKLAAGAGPNALGAG